MHDMVESTKEHYQEVICLQCADLKKDQEWFVDDKGGKDMSYKCTYDCAPTRLTRNIECKVK